jgi:hypothetical protein
MRVRHKERKKVFGWKERREGAERGKTKMNVGQ